MRILSDPRPQENQDLEGCVFDVSLKFSRAWSICIGLKYVGGNPDDWRSYQFDHANIWKNGINEPTGVAEKEVLKILRKNRVSWSHVPDYLS